MFFVSRDRFFTTGWLRTGFPFMYWLVFDTQGFEHGCLKIWVCLKIQGRTKIPWFKILSVIFTFFLWIVIRGPIIAHFQAVPFWGPVSDVLHRTSEKHPECSKFCSFSRNSWSKYYNTHVYVYIYIYVATSVFAAKAIKWIYLYLYIYIIYILYIYIHISYTWQPNTVN